MLTADINPSFETKKEKKKLILQEHRKVKPQLNYIY